MALSVDFHSGLREQGPIGPQKSSDSNQHRHDAANAISSQKQQYTGSQLGHLIEFGNVRNLGGFGAPARFVDLHATQSGSHDRRLHTVLVGATIEIPDNMLAFGWTPILDIC